jgi:hypothetical protein
MWLSKTPSSVTLQLRKADSFGARRKRVSKSNLFFLSEISGKLSSKLQITRNSMKKLPADF